MVCPRSQSKERATFVFRSDSHALELTHLWATNSGLSKLQPALGSINTYLAWHSYFGCFVLFHFQRQSLLYTGPCGWRQPQTLPDPPASTFLGLWLWVSSTDVLWGAWTQGFVHKQALLPSELFLQLYVYSCFVLQRQDLGIAMHCMAHKLSNADRICAGLLPRRFVHLQEHF